MAPPVAYSPSAHATAAPEPHSKPAGQGSHEADPPVDVVPGEHGFVISNLK